MREISLVGKRGEETGSGKPFREMVSPEDSLDFSEFTNQLEENVPIMKWLLPWGRLALDEIDKPSKSDDGPIWWIRPGEQTVSCQQGTPIKVSLAVVSQMMTVTLRQTSGKSDSSGRGILVS